MKHFKELYVVFYKTDPCEYVFETEIEAVEFADVDADLYDNARDEYSIVRYGPLSE